MVGGLSVSSSSSNSSLYKEMNEGRRMRSEHILLCVIEGDATGLQIAEYYCAARGTPITNILSVPISEPTTSPNVSNADEVVLLAAIQAAVDTNNSIQ